MLILMFLFNLAHSETDQWRCTEESTSRSVNVWLACGVGESSQSESEAREKSAEHAINEFESLCSIDSKCKRSKKEIEPKRTSCIAYVQGGYTYAWKCYRLIQITTD